MKIGFMGLGQMGRGMAARLLDRGPELVVWNRTRTVAEALQARGARVARRAPELIPEQYRAAIERGYGEKDWASLGNYIAESAGL